ncbi:nucleoside 2-deoxyribosyltransferase [Desmospora profundinema]|uniref:Nucleoside 2-deoxyribosyltransferase n=1 Tax=Desmospora profundinema TaxID=1571184 RepID=A0ABU1IQ48_9BACL|nr:nucleoside 2-deoxyribosyltransferase [Desmospora profundinema]
MNPGEVFIRLENDPEVDARTVQDAIFTHIRNSTFVTVANVDGYLGKAFEMGYAAAYGIRILTIEPVEDPNLAGYTQRLDAVFPSWRGSKSRR